MLSFSNKVSEQKEEDEASSEFSKTKKNKQPKNFADLVLQLGDIIEEEPEVQKPKLSQCGLITCFVFIIITNILVNVDHG